MSNPCVQERSIGTLEATTEAIQGTLDRLEKGQERFITILESMAEQAAKIDKLEDDVDNLYGRVRDNELSTERLKVQVGLAATAISSVVSMVGTYVVKLIGG